MREQITSIFKYHPEKHPEAQAAMIQELADLDTEIEPLQRRAEFLRRKLGLLGIEAGVEDDGDGAS